jgi:hypothetical protein
VPGRHGDALAVVAKKTPEIGRFKGQYRKGRTLAMVNRALGLVRAAVNWGRFQNPPLFLTSRFIASASASSD